MLVRALPILMALTLCGCSMTELLPDWSSKDYAGPEPAMGSDIANRIAGVVGSSDRQGQMAVSAPRRSDSEKGPSWLYCVRTQAGGDLPRYYAVFVQYDKVVQSRLSVVIDQCELQNFTALRVVRDGVVPSTEIERKQRADQSR